MPRQDDDDFEDDRPRKPRKPRRRDDDDDFEEAPRSSRTTSSGGNAAVKIIGIVAGTILLLCGGAATAVWVGCNRVIDKAKQSVEELSKTNLEQMKNNGEANEVRDRLKEMYQRITTFEGQNGTLPGDSYSATGQPLLSWRVHLLPAYGQDGLYKKFKLDEPWDSPNNKPLIKEMPGFYSTGAARAKAGNDKTYFRGYTGQGGAFQRANNQPLSTKGNPFVAFPDGVSNTILVFEAGDPIEWTRPDNLVNFPVNVGGVSPQNPYFMVLMTDGVVKKAKRNLNPETFKLLLNRQDGMVLPQDWEVP